MEQQKILWVLLSVLAVLMVVIMAGVFIFYPGDGMPQSAGMASAEESLLQDSAPPRETFDPIEYIREKEGVPGLEKGAPAGEDKDMYVVTVIEESGDAAEGGMAAEPVSVAPSTPEDVKAVTQGPSQSVTRTAAPRGQETAAPKSSAPKQTRTEKVVTYWIQVGSFGSRIKAQNVKDDLKDKGVASTISTLEKDDSLYYRVRVGAYQSKSEAEHFCGELKGLQGFQGSYVSAVWGTRQVQID